MLLFERGYHRHHDLHKARALGTLRPKAPSLNLSHVKPGEGAASLLAVTGLIACKDASFVEAFSCAWTPPSTFYTLL